MAIHSSRNEDARRKVSHTWHRQNATRKKNNSSYATGYSRKAFSVAAYN